MKAKVIDPKGRREMNGPIAFTYDADIHCIGCAVARFGIKILDPNPKVEQPTDSEGNSLYAVMPWEELNPDGEWCGDCHCQIVAPAMYRPHVRMEDEGDCWNDCNEMHALYL